MTQSTRKLIGTLLLLVSLVVWGAVATSIYLALLQDMAWYIHIPYFAVAGLGWLYPAMVIIRWMAKPDVVARER